MGKRCRNPKTGISLKPAALCATVAPRYGPPVFAAELCEVGEFCVSLDLEDVRKVAELARLDLAPANLPDYARELSAILALVEALGAAATEGIEPMAHPLDLPARLRADAVTEQDQRQAFQAIAPATGDGLYLVPRVIE